MKNDLISKGKYLSFLLRHDTSYKFDRNGWREVKDLVDNHGYTMSELEEIVATNDKKRYEFSSDKKKIRALQGHSIQVDVELKETLPPDVLYHGTATRFLEQILKTGIKKDVKALCSVVWKYKDGGRSRSKTWNSCDLRN